MSIVRAVETGTFEDDPGAGADLAFQRFFSAFRTEHFIVLLPFIAVYGLFGWMSGGDAVSLIDYNAIYEQMPSEYREQFEANEVQLSEIERVFAENGLTTTDISKAKTIYLSCLIGKELEDGFYQKYAECFLADGEETDLLNSVSSAFDVTFSDEDRQQFENLYGGS